MRLELTDRVRLEAVPAEGRIVARLWVGDREVPVDNEVLRAVAGLFTGDRSEAVVRALATRGVLTPAEAPPRAPALEGRVALAPTLAIGIDLKAGEVTLPSRHGPVPRRVLPGNSLPIGLFVPPRWLDPLQRLAGWVTEGWYQMLRAATSRGQQIDTALAADHLEGLVRERLGTDPALQNIVDIEGDRLVPLVPLQDGEVHYPIARLALLPDRNHAQGPPVWVPIDGDPSRLHAVAGLLARLSVGAAAAEVEAHVQSAGSALLRTVWSQLLEAGLVVEAPEARRLAESCPPGTICHLGHATLLANLGGAHVLIDPWLIPGSRVDARPPPSVYDLPPLAAVFFTHHHWDHVNLETLLKLPRDVPMYVPRQAEAPLRPRTELLLRHLGFRDVRELAPGEEVELGQGGRVVAAPFYGEDPTSVGYVGNTYVLQHEGRAAWVHVDSGTDVKGRSAVSTGTAAALRERFGDLSPVFATRRQERGTLVEHSWEYLFQPFAQWTRPTENGCNDAGFLAALARESGTSHLVLYSEGGADWYPDRTDFLRGSRPRPRDAVFEFLWDDEATIRSAVEGEGAAMTASQPWARFQVGGGPDGELP